MKTSGVCHVKGRSLKETDYKKFFAFNSKNQEKDVKKISNEKESIS